MFTCVISSCMVTCKLYSFYEKKEYEKVTSCQIYSGNLFLWITFILFRSTHSSSGDSSMSNHFFFFHLRRWHVTVLPQDKILTQKPKHQTYRVLKYEKRKKEEACRLTDSGRYQSDIVLVQQKDNTAIHHLHPFWIGWQSITGLIHKQFRFIK